MKTQKCKLITAASLCAAIIVPSIASAATFTQNFQIDPLTSSLSCSGYSCTTSLSYPIAGTFSMVVDDSLGYINMTLAAINVTTPPLPDGPFQMPSQTLGYFARFDGPTFYGNNNDCGWPLPFGAGSCYSIGNFSSFSGSLTGLSLSMTGSQALNYFSSNVYTIKASAVPVPAAFWMLGSGLLGLIGVGRRKAA